MIYALLTFFAILLVGDASLTERDYQAAFTKFMREHGRTYDMSDMFNRFNIFRDNLDFIHSHDETRGFTLGMNQFGDLTSEEFSSMYLGLQVEDRERNYVDLSHVEVASALDWEARGAVTHVKNQGQCGSCWAFSTTGALEGAHQIASGELLSLSEQHLVDCAGRYGNLGCNGGLMDRAFQYVASNGGLCLEDEYPYLAKKQFFCQSSQCSSGYHAPITGFNDVRSGDENALMQALNLGPVSVAIEADKRVFQLYSGGVLDDSGCGTQLDHGVLLVGYGTDGQDYWRVKNSWGDSWGEQGFIRMVRGKNQCGLASQPSYPTGASQ